MTVDPEYATALRANMLSFLVVLIAAVAWRYRAMRLERAVDALREESALGEGDPHVAGV